MIIVLIFFNISHDLYTYSSIINYIEDTGSGYLPPPVLLVIRREAVIFENLKLNVKYLLCNFYIAVHNYVWE